MLILATSVWIVAAITLAAASDPSGGWFDYLNKGGVLAVFLIIAYALLSKRIVMGWTYQDMVKERDYYRALAENSTDLTKRSVQSLGDLVAQRETMDALVDLRAEILAARRKNDTPDAS